MSAATEKKRFPTAPVAIALFAAYFIACFFLPPKFNHQAYLASIIDKHRALERAQSPKIVLVGGSNLAFGVDSDALSKAFGEPVVNMGVSKMFGLRYQFEEVKDALQPGDTVVIVPEYDCFRGDTGGSSYLLNVPLLMPRSLGWVLRSYCSTAEGPWQLVCDFVGVPSGKWNYWRKAIEQITAHGAYPQSMPLSNPGEPPVISRRGFTINGDFRGHIDQPTPYDRYMKLSKEPIDPKIIDVVNRFQSFAQKGGIEVVIMPPPIPAEVYSKHQKLVDSTYDLWVKNFHCRIAGTPQRYLFAQNCFYNSLYHLHHMSTIEEHTDRMIQDLSQTALRPRHDSIQL
ncbi:MAG TPA: hypothetical protein V6C81_12650 [Planktothrix sp.]|jgi:hypothetical protein